MAVWTVVEQSVLAEGLVIAPERYHPGRRLQVGEQAVRLSTIASMVQETVTANASSTSSSPVLVIDTCDVSQGTVDGRKAPQQGVRIRSAKKRVRAGDVLVSRLRPYLRQIGFVDETLAMASESGEVTLLCSTEFIVLRSRDGNPIAFLVPFLLSDAVQKVFAAAVEGGHHPRFDPTVVMSLPIPTSILHQREQLSARVEDGIRALRRSEIALASVLEDVSAFV